MISVRTASGDKAIGGVSIRTPAGDKIIGRVSVLTPGGSKLIYTTAGGGGLAVSVEPVAVIGGAVNDASVPVQTSFATATATGGTPPYTYAWALDAGTVGWSAIAPTAATTRFRFASLGPGDGEIGTFEVTVTDARGRTGTATVEVSAYNYGSMF